PVPRPGGRRAQVALRADLRHRPLVPDEIEVGEWMPAAGAEEGAPVTPALQQADRPGDRGPLLLDLDYQYREPTPDQVLRAPEHVQLVPFHVDLDDADIVHVKIVKPDRLHHDRAAGSLRVKRGQALGALAARGQPQLR